MLCDNKTPELANRHHLFAALPCRGQRFRAATLPRSFP